ncbi:serine protease [Coraliomargarita sp. SDUM461004]|uniref:Serine protease n=1 Tax=Thalassobacterium sedimentorum TaxID=3041258 RepID=A0ABU1ANP1_9BACT|nr:serine protease [Coraliomargarita sp. SDUM461004]MDQ8196407.1 serine protease [Coraliomargarita sp. SDUM461004]
MNCKSLVFVVVATVVSTFSVNATERTLTDTKGRTIDVLLLAKTDAGISVMRTDGLELDISYDLLSISDRDFISQWEPPKPELPESPVDAVVIISTTGSTGTGFFAHDAGKTYLYTNQHVISDIFNVKVTDSRGDPVELAELEISNSQDVARFRVRSRPAFLITDSAESNEKVTVLGNSEGAGVITSGPGQIKGIGPFEIEVDADFVPGNSGGPVINSENSVIGIATYISPGDERPDWVTKDTRYSKARRFTIRPSRVEDWRNISREEYAKQIGELESAINLFNQIYWTYLMLDEGKGYVSNIPENWHRDVLQILRNHNSRQKRPDATRTSYYVDGYYTGSTTKSHAETKEASRRANLRALMRVIEDEFGDLYNLKNRQLDIGYLLENKYESAEVLEGWLTSLKGQINNEIAFSKSSF